ncbi:hypothetical protein Zmor_001092 [Zophobas morio]|uniref:Sm domain-containing protein n=1 Tax=Zophobas morio TaxID=2755281 RepID=A0AA38MR92_9CUCU|nr:hypothetical protein Zmor_001092 [Zophobas morio]
MASDGMSNVGNEEEPNDNDKYNPKLDFFSEEFDPLLALKTPNLVVPVSNATTHDNLQKFKSVVEGKRQENTSKVAEISTEVSIERRWLPHQLPIQVKRKTISKNVLSKMETVVGPLQLLKTCKDNQHRIKVWTRHSHGIRGFCIGYIAAFDKHWNLALEDVEEVWTRPKRRKVPALNSAKADLKIQPKVLPPPVTIVKSTKKTETCSRHVSQLLLRGEHIAYIVVIPDETKS